MCPAFHSSFSRTSPSWISPVRIRSSTFSGVASVMRFLMSAKYSRYVGIPAPLGLILNRLVHSEIPDMLGFPRGNTVFRPAPAPVPPGARHPRGRVARAWHRSRTRALRVVTLAGRCGRAVRQHPRPFRWSRRLLGDRAGYHQRAEGGRLRSHRRTRRAPGAALGRTHGPRGFDALLERLGQPRCPPDPRRDHRFRRAAPELARAGRVREIAPAVSSRDERRRRHRPRRAVPLLMARTATLPRAVERVLVP